MNGDGNKEEGEGRANERGMGEGDGRGGGSEVGTSGGSKGIGKYVSRVCRGGLVIDRGVGVVTARRAGTWLVVSEANEYCRTGEMSP